MYVIKPSTRTAWEDILTGEYHVEESTAKTLIDLIVGDPRISFSRPQNRDELISVVDEVRTVIDEMDFTDYGDVEDHENLKNELVGRLRIDLGVTGQRQPGEATSGTVDAPQAGTVDDPGTVGALNAKKIDEQPEEEPPEELRPFIDKFVEQIENENTEFSIDDLQKIVQWVSQEVQYSSED